MAKAIVAGVAAVTGSRLFRKHLLAFLGPFSAACLGTATLPRRRPRAAGPVPDAELAQGKGQFLPDEMMPSSGAATALAVDKLAGNITKPVNISLTYTISFAIAANKLERYTK